MGLLATLRPHCTKMSHSVSHLYKEEVTLCYNCIYTLMILLCVFGRYKTRNTFTGNVLLVPHPLPPQSKLHTQHSIIVPWSFCERNSRHDCVHILILFSSSNSSFNSNPSPYLVMMMSQCDSGAATTGRRCGMNGP